MVSLPENFVAIDTETTGLYPWKGDRVFAASAAFPNGRILFWRDEFSGLQELLADDAVEKVFHNAKFDVRMLRASGFKTLGKIHDTMALAHLTNPRNPIDLESCAKIYLPPERRKIVREINDWFDEHKVSKSKRGKHFIDLPPDVLKRRNVGDAVLTLLLFKKLYSRTMQLYTFLYQQEMDLIPVVARMEERGITIDGEELDIQKEFLGEVIEDGLLYLEDMVGREINPRSYDDKLAILKTAGVLDRLKKRTKKDGKVRMRKEDLRSVHHPVTHAMLRFGLATKLLDTFIAQVETQNIDSVVHSSFNQFGTVTGRFSSSKPNMQNIPREGGQLTADEEAEDLEDVPLAPHIKRIFVARPGHVFISADKKQIEVRMLIHYGKDSIGKIMIESGRDLHFEICKRMFGEATDKLKVRAKKVVFGYMFGMSTKTLAEFLNSTISEAASYRSSLRRALPNLNMLMGKWKQQVYENGYVQTEHGRRHFLTPNEDYMAVNRMCQGTAADELKGNMIDLDAALTPLDGHILLQIHDDIVAEVPVESVQRATKIVQEVVSSSRIPYFVPMIADVKTTGNGGRWSELA